jgi:hypothetical protein
MVSVMFDPSMSRIKQIDYGICVSEAQQHPARPPTFVRPILGRLSRGDIADLPVAVGVQKKGPRRTGALIEDLLNSLS